MEPATRGPEASRLIDGAKFFPGGEVCRAAAAARSLVSRICEINETGSGEERAGSGGVMRGAPHGAQGRSVSRVAGD